MKKVSGVDNTITGFVLGFILIFEKGAEGGKKAKQVTYYVLLQDNMATFSDH
jgi:hypothetical protein